MNKPEFIMRELGTIANDINQAILDQQTKLEHQRQMRQQAIDKSDKTDEGLSALPPFIGYPGDMQEQVDYFLTRLHAVKDYLSGKPTDVSATIKFLGELGRKLTS